MGFHPLTHVNEAVSHLLDHDALVVLAPGLGVHSVLLEFLREFHIQNGCHPGSRPRVTEKSVPVEKDKLVEPVSKLTRPRGKLVGAPAGAESIDESQQESDRPAAKRSSKVGENRKKNETPVGSRLILLLNTSNEEAQVIKKRAEMMGLVKKEKDLEEGSDTEDGVEERRRKKRRLMNDEENEILNEAYVNPFIEESPIQLSFHIHTPSGQADLPEKRQSEYSKGGIFVIKSRLLVTDVLCGRLPPEIIDGIIVNHAEK